MHDTNLVNYIVTLFAIANPFGNLAIFVGLTSDKNDQERRKIAIQTTIAVAIILTITTWAGGPLLDLFGISIPAFQMAGGLIITLLGLSMLHSKSGAMSHSSEEHEDAEQKDSIAVVPMAIPIIAGPGAMTTVIVFISQHQTIMDRTTVTLANLAVTLVLGITLFFSSKISSWLGVSGIKIAVRVMGLVLVAMAMSMLIAGLTGAFPALTSH